MLSSEQVRHLNADYGFLQECGLKRTRIIVNDEFCDLLGHFNRCTAKFMFPHGYSKYVPLTCKIEIDETPQFQQVNKRDDGKGFFPTIAAYQLTIQFDYISKRIENNINLLEKHVTGLVVVRDDDKTVTLTFPTDNKSIWEFQFMPHSFGFRLSKLEVVE